MKKTKINNLTEYLSLTLIISYFFFHSIFFVLIGISISLYLININLINSFKRYMNKMLVIKRTSSEQNKKVKSKKSDLNNIKLTKEDKNLTLVETIEVLGFIPSQDKDNDINAA